MCIRDRFRKIVKSVPKLVNGEGCSIFLRRHFFKLPDDTCIESLPGERQIKGLPAFLVETTELNRRLIGEAYYEPNLTDGLTGGVLFTGTPLNIPGGPGARKARLGECNWTGGKYASTDPNKTADYYANRPFLATPIKDSRGHVLGVIRVADAADGKTEFHENDVDIVTACAMQLGSALEANSTEWYFNQVLQEVKGLKSECAKQSGLGEIRRMIGKLDRQPLYMPLALPLLFFAVGVAGCGAVLTVVAAFRDIAWPWRITLISVTAVAFLVAYWAWRSYRSWQTKALRQSRVAHHRR